MDNRIEATTTATDAASPATASQRTILKSVCRS